jgi:hypothetical protein
VRVRIATFAPVNLYQSACLLAYQDDDNYVTVCRDYVNAQLVEWWHETSGSPAVLSSTPATATSNLVLRLDRDRTTNTITAFMSTDGGSNWTQLPGSVVKSLANPRLGIFVGGNISSSAVTADVSWAEVRSNAPPVASLQASPARLSFSRISGGAVPGPQKILLSNPAPGTLNWSATANQPWLSVTSSGATPGALTVAVAPGTLAPGRYDGIVTVTAASATNSPYQIPVTLTVVSLNDRRLLSATILVNGANTSGFNTNPAAPGEFQRYLERYLEHLQIPYEIIDTSTTTPVVDFFDRQLIITGHRGVNLSPAWQDAIANAVNLGSGFLNLDWDPTIGTQSHIQTIFGATGSQAGAPAQSITVPAGVLSDGLTPHYITGLQQRFSGDPAGDIVYAFHKNAANDIQSVRSTVLTGALGTVLARTGNDPLIIATAYGAGRAVHVGTQEYLKADRFGFLQGIDDLFWRGVVWAARKPFALRGYPKFWAVQMDDTVEDWGFRVRDLYDTTLTGTLQANGTGGPWKVTGYLYIFNLVPGSEERASVITDINAGKLMVSPHALEGASFGDLYWNPAPHELTDAEWLSNISEFLDWHEGFGGADRIPDMSRSAVAHFWDLSNNTGFDLWNQFGFRYLTSIQKPGFQRGTDYAGAERIHARPFWLYELPAKFTPDEEQSFFFADDISVNSRAGLPAQNLFLFTTQVKSIGELRPDVAWPSAKTPQGDPWSVQQSVGQFQRTTWRLWSSMAPVQIFTHDTDNYINSTVSDRRSVIQTVSSWLNTNGVRHRFMEELGDYIYARTKSQLTRAEVDGGNVTLGFTGNAATADGLLIDTELRLFLNDDDGTVLTVPGFTGGRLFTTPIGGS